MRGFVGVNRRAALKTEEMKESPGLPRPARSRRLPYSTLTRVRWRQESPLHSGPGLRVGAGVARMAEGQRWAGSCGSASGLSRISLLLGLS